MKSVINAAVIFAQLTVFLLLALLSKTREAVGNTYAKSVQMRKKKRPGTRPTDILVSRENGSHTAHVFLPNKDHYHIINQGGAACWCECEAIKIIHQDENQVWRVFVHAPLKSGEVLNAHFVKVKGDYHGNKS